MSRCWLFNFFYLLFAFETFFYFEISVNAIFNESSRTRVKVLVACFCCNASWRRWLNAPTPRPSLPTPFQALFGGVCLLGLRPGRMPFHPSSAAHALPGPFGGAPMPDGPNCLQTAARSLFALRELQEDSPTSACQRHVTGPDP